MCDTVWREIEWNLRYDIMVVIGYDKGTTAIKIINEINKRKGGETSMILIGKHR